MKIGNFVIFNNVPLMT